MRTRGWLRGVGPSEHRVEVRAPARVILLPNDVEGRRDRPRRRPAERVDEALVEVRGAQVGKGVERIGGFILLFNSTALWATGKDSLKL